MTTVEVIVSKLTFVQLMHLHANAIQL